MNKAYLGIDPGVTGAIAVLWPIGDPVAFFDMDGSDLDMLDFLRKVKDDADILGFELAAVLENVNSFKMGRQSAFKFGGAHRGARVALLALGIPLIAEPIPSVWKKAIFGACIKGLDSKALKTASRDKARQLFPATASQLARVKDADRAEALLLSFYGRMMERGGK